MSRKASNISFVEVRVIVVVDFVICTAVKNTAVRLGSSSHQSFLLYLAFHIGAELKLNV
jgi:hypothetical protein